MSLKESEIEQRIINKLGEMKYTYRPHMRFVASILGSYKGRAALSKLAKGTSDSMKNITIPDVLAFLTWIHRHLNNNASPTAFHLSATLFLRRTKDSTLSKPIKRFGAPALSNAGTNLITFKVTYSCK